MIINFSHTVGNSDAGKAAATRKSIAANFLHTVGNSDADKTAATRKSTAANSNYTVRKLYIGKAAAAKRCITNDFDIARDFIRSLLKAARITYKALVPLGKKYAVNDFKRS